MTDLIDKLQNAIVLTDLPFYKAVLDALEVNIALLDRHGTILAVNARWQRFGEANGIRDPRFGVGANYFAVCQAAVDPVARAAVTGIQEVLSGRQSSFYIEYPCHSPDEERWFALRATPLADYPNFAVVAHENITQRVVAEKKLARQEFARLVQHERLKSVVRGTPESQRQVENHTAERQFRELCADYLELASWIDDRQSAHAGTREPEDARRLLESLARDIESYLRG